jgi:hypothetical protein
MMTNYDDTLFRKTFPTMKSYGNIFSKKIKSYDDKLLRKNLCIPVIYIIL